MADIRVTPALDQNAGDPTASPPVAQPPTIVQPVIVQTPVVQPAAVAATDDQLELRIYSHSNLIYWWPVWLVGFVAAFFTYAEGSQVQIGDTAAWFHSSANPGVFFFFTLFLVILITNVAVRGLASAIVILSLILAVLFLAYMGWWDDVLGWVGNLRIYLNLGAYLVFSTLLFAVWVATVFFFDRFSYWRIKPGQVTQEFVFGAGSRSYDTDNMVVEKYRDDIFRHWVLGLGSGDLRIRPYGASQEEISIPNVFFVGSKLRMIQKMIATEPDKFGHAVLK
jgi:hypothetical protein